MIRCLHIVTALYILIFSQTVCYAQAPPKALSPCGSGYVSEALDGNTLILTDNRRVKLSAIKAPELWPMGAPHKSWPYSTQSKKVLNHIAGDQKISLLCEGKTKTYDGYIIAHVVLSDGLWLQHMLVAQGTVYVFPRAGHTSGTDTLYTAEMHARKNTLGLWGTNAETLKSSEATIPTGWFQIVTGKIISVGKSTDRTYLNFGANWRDDFTVEIPRNAHKVFARSNQDPTQWQGKTIEARGWIDWKGGPRLVADNPGQIRVLD